MKRATLADLKGGDPSRNADALKAVLAGADGGYRAAVLMTAGAAFVVAGKAPDLKSRSGARRREHRFGQGHGRARQAHRRVAQLNMATVLDRIAAYKREEVARARAEMSLSVLEREALEAPPVRAFGGALEAKIAAGAWALVAEIKEGKSLEGTDPRRLQSSRACRRL